VKVALFDINAQKGEALTDAIGGVFCQVNVTHDDSVHAGLEKARVAHGQERILVNCAGMGNAIKTASRDKTTALDAFDRIIQINLAGAFRCIPKSAAGMLTLDPLADDERRASSTRQASPRKMDRLARSPMRHQQPASLA
jgi:NAD(P)-dependent dehydrogenase (short-subunit alcohol dehydrogenase family)